MSTENSSHRDLIPPRLDTCCRTSPCGSWMEANGDQWLEVKRKRDNSLWPIPFILRNRQPGICRAFGQQTLHKNSKV